MWHILQYLWMNNQIWHEAVVVVKKTEKCKSELTTSSDSDTHAGKKIADLVKIVTSLKNRKKKKTD